MLVREIINTDIAPLRKSDTVALALTKLDLMHTTQFGVVDADGKLAGMIRLETLLTIEDEQEKLAQVPLREAIFVPLDQHLFEAARLMLAHELYVLPVVDEEGKFHGLIKKREILNALGDIFNLSSYGSVISVELDQKDFTLSELVHIIETEGAKILGVAVQQPKAEYPFYRVSFKLNLKDSSVVSAGLRRFGYTITSEARSETFEGNLTERADELMRYLDI